MAFRFFALNPGEDIGKLNIFGWGLRHSISQYLENVPVDLAVGYYWNSYEVEEYIDATASMISIQVGKKVSLVDFYGGFGFEFAESLITYPASEEGEDDVRLDLDTSNNFRFTAGAAFNFGPFKLNGDLNLGRTNTFVVALGFAIGN